jgi:hypothetical protein
METMIVATLEHAIEVVTSMIWFLVGVIVFLAALLLVYRWAAGKTPRKGAFRGRGSYSGAGVAEAFREDGPHSGSSDEPK